MDKIGDYLKKVRIQQGLSLKDVYKATGISDSRLSRIENGTKDLELKPAFLKALAELYNIRLVDLLINAGYLNTEDLASYERVFQDVDFLSDAEKKHIQEQIDLFTKGRKNI